MLRSQQSRLQTKGTKALFFKPPSTSTTGSFSPSKVDRTTTKNSLQEASSLSGFSQSEIQDLRESFCLMDIENEGSITAGHLRHLLLSLQDGDRDSGTVVYPHLQKLLAELESLPSEQVLDFDAYLELMAKTSLHRTMQEEEGTNYAHVFQLFDLDDKGYIDIEDLKRIAIDLGESDIPQEELEEMIRRAQTKHKGRVYLEEFARMMNLNLFQNADPSNT